MTPTWLRQKNEVVDFVTIMKGWWSKGQFRAKVASTEWKNSKLRKSVQIIFILLSKDFGRKDGSTFPNKWIPIIYQIITSRSTLNCAKIISSNLDAQLRKFWKDHQFYMSSYIMDVMCASLEFSSLGWKWESNLPLIHLYYNMLWDTKYKDDYELICNGLFTTLY